MCPAPVAERPHLRVIEGGCPDCPTLDELPTLIDAAEHIVSCRCPCHDYPLNEASLAFSLSVIYGGHHLQPVA